MINRIFFYSFKIINKIKAPPPSRTKGNDKDEPKLSSEFPAVFTRLSKECATVEVVPLTSLLICENGSDKTFKKREYYGPIKLEKLNIRLLDRFGKPLSLAQNDYSFVLDIKQYILDVKPTLSIYDEFGIIIPKTIDLTFNNVKKELLKLVKKNKEKFIKLIDKQKKMYKSLIK